MDERKTGETAGDGEELETDAKVGPTAGEVSNTEHAIRPVEGQETSMHFEEPQRVTDDDSRMTPLRGEYEEEDDNDESWHDAIED